MADEESKRFAIEVARFENFRDKAHCRGCGKSTMRDGICIVHIDNWVYRSTSMEQWIFVCPPCVLANRNTLDPLGPGGFWDKMVRGPQPEEQKTNQE